MELKKYMDDKSTEALVKLIKTSTAKVYKVKGSAIYADTDYVTHAQNNDDGYFTTIDSEGLWQNINGTWTKITEFEEGWVYNIDNAFTTDSDFVEGSGKAIEAGNNIVVCRAPIDPNSEVPSEDPSPMPSPRPPRVIYKWDLLGSLFNMSTLQTKALVEPLTVFSSTDDTATTYASSAALPASQSKADSIIETYDAAVITGGTEAGDIYRAVVTENSQDATLEDIAWVKLGNQLTVEGALELLSKICPNTPITDAEIEAMWNRV